MGSVFQPLNRMVGRGFDRSKQRHQISLEACWDLLNLRPVLGRLEQTPWLQNYQALSLLTGESSTSPVHFLKLVKNLAGSIKYLLLNETNARFIDSVTPSVQTLVPSVIQIAKPNDATLTGECLLSGISALDFVNAGDQFDVQTTSATTFQWRKNGGSWNSGLTIAQTVVLTGTVGLSVNFQGQGNPSTDFINYPIGSTWSWQRQNTTPFSLAEPTTFNVNFPSDCYMRDTYVGAVGRNILRVRNDMITSVGYTRVYGYHVAVFYNHLFVSQYAPGVYDPIKGIVDSYNSLDTPFTLGWSHLSNPDQFYYTLINEADQYEFPTQTYYELNDIGISGLAPWRGLLYVFTTDGIQTGQYVGLPNVMQFTPLNSNVGSIFKSGMVRTPFGIYFIGRNDVYVIRLFEAQAIGIKVRTKFFNEICPYTDTHFQSTFGYYNPYTKEVIWTYWIYISNNVYQQRQMVYCELTDDWYFRNVPCAASGVSDTLAIAPQYGTFGQNLYGYTGYLNQDQPSGTIANAIPDVAATQNYTAPYFETPFITYGNDPFHVKQDDGLHIDASWNSGTQLIISRSTQDLIGSGATNMKALQETWRPGLDPVRLSTPRESFRQNAYRFQFDNGTQPVYGAIFNMYQEFIRGPQENVERS